MIACALIAATGQSITVFIAQVRYAEVGLPSSLFGLASMLMILIGMGSAFMSFKVTNAIGERKSAVVFIALAAAGCFLAAFARTQEMVICAICLLKSGVSCLAPLYASLQCRNSPEEGKAVVLSMFALVNEFAEMLLSVIYGLIADVDVSSVLVCAGCVCFVAIATGRKNWLFCQSIDGADASALCYSLVETAKLQGISPLDYLEYVFTLAPDCRTEDDWRSLLPWNFDISRISGARSARMSALPDPGRQKPYIICGAGR